MQSLMRIAIQGRAPEFFGGATRFSEMYSCASEPVQGVETDDLPAQMRIDDVMTSRCSSGVTSRVPKGVPVTSF